ncbi:hypothetical protein CBR_g9096 [Chara braunii]|uniref:CCHC-type domain-containing protein n=1 Tax=Chara braunii TaxID=69332 RepID=A0A388KP16_CHABU|nr:hypothetical protein CBR_g9096 [Chara braunii]|eukprot:GBG71683.1 hypothetical protein CBR_g9096 [Chara braunii]
MSEEGDSRRGTEGGGGMPRDGRKCYKYGEGGHYIRDCADYWRAKAQGRPFAPSVISTGQTRSGRSTSGSDSFGFRRSRFAESGGDCNERGDSTDEKYFMQMVEERRERIEREREEERRRVEDEARWVKETRRALREEQRIRHKEERDVRLMRILRSEFQREGARSADKGKKPVRAIEKRLRRSIAQRTFGMEEAEDEELLALRKQAARLELLEKRKRDPDLPVGNSPPIFTLEKRSNT